MSDKLGISGRIARTFLLSEITPLLALVGLLLGVFAVIVTPREEEPQINVTFANIFIPFPGASATEVEHLVSTPAEQVLSEIEGIKHVYSVSRPGMSVLTLQYKVGEDRTSAIVRLYNAMYSKQDWLPRNSGIGQPVIKPKGIDDVPIVSLTLWSEKEDVNVSDLQRVAHALEAELKKVPGTRDIYTLGHSDRVLHVVLDSQKASAYGISVNALKLALGSANQSAEAGSIINHNQVIPVQAGRFLINADEVASLIVGVYQDKPVYLSDVAKITEEIDQPKHYVWFGTGAAAAARKDIARHGEFNAVTIAIAKKPGTNAVKIAASVIERIEALKGVYIPDGIHVTVTRDYGATANEKAQTLIGKLVFATGFVVLLVFFALGWREAIIVGVAVVITLAMTLFASWAWGFTLNRVSLFALIFSIGILVDDAIVVVENIHRHIQLGGKKLVEAIPLAVDEVGGPTILATFAVIAALLPMAFVTGLMGPYMSPIPINASIGMLISLAVAFIMTPWLTYKVLHGVEHAHSGDSGFQKKLDHLFKRLMQPFLVGEKARKKRLLLGLVVLILIAASVGLAVNKTVVLKMLPFDNKSEFQIVVDMPEGSSVEKTAAVMRDLSRYIASVPEVVDYQAYAGLASPINFNGLVRQYYLRDGHFVGDIQVNLIHKSRRERKSHEVAQSMREPLQKIGRQFNANVKVVEVPPGPPVMSPLVAEIYGLDYQGQIAIAKRIRKIFESTPDIVDVDDSVEFAGDKLIAHVDRQKAALLGVTQRDVNDLIYAALHGVDVTYLHGENVKYPVPIRLELPEADKSSIQTILDLKIPGRDGKLVPLGELVRIEKVKRQVSIYHKDLMPVVYVTADMSGKLDSPLYGMFDIYNQLGKTPVTPDLPIQQNLLSAPQTPYQFGLKWDGEWQITYDTFRDMGIAYSVGLLMIYLLVVAQFRSYVVPLIIMSPIPLTIIGVMPGHALLGAQFTATSMIGMIALAGIIVRNSILLVDFINEEVRKGVDFQTAVIQSGSVRAKPIILTGLAAMLGALFILDDPIFSGLAISLIFGIMVSTILTLLLIPVMYYAFMHKRIKNII